MLFAAKLQAGERTRITALVPGSLVLTNITLQEGSKQAKLYLQTNGDEEMMVVALAQPTLTAYHTEVRLSLPKKGRQTLVSRNGSVYLLGHFSPDDEEKKSSPIDEVLSVKRGDSAKQPKSSKPSVEPVQEPRQESTKLEAKQKPEEANDAPVRRSTRVRTPAPPPKSQAKSKKQARMRTGSKGNSLLDMMYNMGDDDDEDESEYSEQEESSSSSSSSSDQDSDETPKKSSKKDSKQEKIQRKGDEDRPSSLPSHVLRKIEAKSKLQFNQSNYQSEQQATQQLKALKQAIAEGLHTSNTQLQQEISNGVQALTTRLLIKVMKELPPPPSKPSSKRHDDASFDATVSQTSEQASWLDLFRKYMAILQDKIQSFSLKDQEDDYQREKERREDKRRFKKELTAVASESIRKEGRRDTKGEQLHARNKKEGRKEQSPFPYQVPTQIPDFLLKK